MQLVPITAGHALWDTYASCTDIFHKYMSYYFHIYVKRMSMYVNNVSCLSMYVALYDDYEAVYVHIICHYILRAWFAKGPRSSYIAVIGQFLLYHFIHYSVPLIRCHHRQSSHFLWPNIISLSLVTIIFVNFAVSGPTLTSDLPVPSPHLLFTQNLISATPCTLPKSQTNRLQVIQNSLARAVVKTPKFCHVTPILKSLHWLKIITRI